MEYAKDAIDEVDMDKDGVISYTEFLYAIADSSTVAVNSNGPSRDAIVRAAAERSGSLSASGVSGVGVEANTHRHSRTMTSNKKNITSTPTSRLRRSTESSLHLSLTNFSMRRSSILSKRAPEAESAAVSDTGGNTQDRGVA